MAEADDDDASLEVTQRGFDPLGPRVRRQEVASGRTVHYVDDGQVDWPVLVFFGGAGTSVRASRLLDFARTLRTELKLRVVSVERNGIGQTPFDPAVAVPEHAQDVWSLLDSRGVAEASIVAISGGGPYAAHVVSQQPRRVRTVHLACALSDLMGDLPEVDIDDVAADPVGWWRFPDESPVHRIPGFVDSVVEEATRAAFARGRDTPPDGLRQAFQIYRSTTFPDLSEVVAPAFLYWGTVDPLVPTTHLRRWEELLPGPVQRRVYADEGHDVQYRHWDQILTDVAFQGRRILVCSEGRTLLATPATAQALLDDGATPGLCAWSDPVSGRR